MHLKSSSHAHVAFLLNMCYRFYIVLLGFAVTRKQIERLTSFKFVPTGSGIMLWNFWSLRQVMHTIRTQETKRWCGEKNEEKHVFAFTRVVAVD